MLQIAEMDDVSDLRFRVEIRTPPVMQKEFHQVLETTWNPRGIVVSLHSGRGSKERKDDQPGDPEPIHECDPCSGGALAWWH